MAWSIAEVARMSKTTSRTLRHYHEIGLLEPAYTGDNGYRYYRREQLLRLQQILLLRDLDLGLPEIGRILAGQQDTPTALRSHLRHLRREQNRLARLQRTVERTIRQIEQGEITMPAEDYFDGFEQKQAAHEQELVDRFGDDAKRHIAESREKTAGWSKDAYMASMAEFRAGLERLAAVRGEGHRPDSEEAQAVIAGHHGWLTQFWTPDRASYTGLGEMYASDERFRGQIDEVDDGLADYLRDAMAAYAERELA
jgi:MerR family transcriptional regulator, thiopeptide resistance regulator